MGGTIWAIAAAVALGLLAIWARPVLFARQTSAARNGRVSREFLYVTVMLVLFAELLFLPGALDSRLVEVALGVFWFGFLALWLAAIILFARKTTGARNARVAREALLVWLLLFAVSVIIGVPGGMEAWLTTAARLFVGETAARRVGKTGLFAVMYAAGAVFWFHQIRRGYVLRPAFLLPLKTEPKEIQRRVDVLWEKPPGPKVRLLLATSLALFSAGAGFYTSSNWAHYDAQWKEERKKQHENWFREYAQLGFPGLLSVYLEEGVDINAAGDNGYTALHVAAVEGHANVAEFLLANGADANAANNNDYTPLHFAVLEGHQDVVEVLLANGAHVNPRNWNGKTPLRLALDKGHDEIARLLREHGGIE